MNYHNVLLSFILRSWMEFFTGSLVFIINLFCVQRILKYCENVIKRRFRWLDQQILENNEAWAMEWKYYERHDVCVWRVIEDKVTTGSGCDGLAVMCCDRLLQDHPSRGQSCDSHMTCVILIDHKMSVYVWQCRQGDIYHFIIQGLGWAVTQYLLNAPHIWGCPGFVDTGTSAANSPTANSPQTWVGRRRNISLRGVLLSRTDHQPSFFLSGLWVVVECCYRLWWLNSPLVPMSVLSCWDLLRAVRVSEVISTGPAALRGHCPFDRSQVPFSWLTRVPFWPMSQTLQLYQKLDKALETCVTLPEL